MNILQEGVKAISNFLGTDQPETTLRERLLDPANVDQDAREVSDAPAPTEAILRQPAPEEAPETYEGLDEFEINSLLDEDLQDDFDPWDGEDFNLENPTEMERNAKLQEEMYRDAEQGIEDDTLGVLMTDEAAKREHLEDVKIAENAGAKGYVKSTSGARFMPFDSLEGQGPDKGMSKQEIGYGIKIPKVWFSKDKKKWPKIDGVPVDISKGITEEQATTMLRDVLEDSDKTAKTKLSKWSDMTAQEKVFWSDLTYNMGAKAIDKNPKAKAAANAGRTVEAMVLALDSIRAAGKPLPGLLNRRLTRYNQAALEITGAPVVEEYNFGEEIKIKFSSDFMTDKVSPKFAKKIKANDGWLTISKGGVDSFVKKADDNFKF